MKLPASESLGGGLALCGDVDGLQFPKPAFGCLGTRVGESEMRGCVTIALCTITKVRKWAEPESRQGLPRVASIRKVRNWAMNCEMPAM